MQHEQNQRFDRSYSKQQEKIVEGLFILFQRPQLPRNGALDDDGKYFQPFQSLHMECLHKSGRRRKLLQARARFWKPGLDTGRFRSHLWPSFGLADKNIQ